MNYAFLHEYEDGRIPLNSGKCVFSGKPGYNKPVDFILAEPPIKNFEESGGDELSWLFNVVDVYREIGMLILALPLEFIDGMAKGYVIELKEFLEDRGYPSIQMVRVNHPYFGSAVEGASIFLICGKEPIPLPVSVNTVVTKAATILPEIITHAHVNPKDITFFGGAGTMNGFGRSNAYPFPELSKWNDEYLMVERRFEDTLKISRLTTEEVATLYGITPIADIPVSAIERIIPTMVHDNFISTFIIK